MVTAGVAGTVGIEMVEKEEGSVKECTWGREITLAALLTDIFQKLIPLT